MSDQPPQPPPNVAVNRDGLGGIDMYTGPTWDIANAVVTAAQDYETRWRQVHTTMQAIEAKIGGVVQFDWLSGEFRNNYNPAAEQIATQQTELVETTRTIGENGMGSVDTYLATDSQVAQRMGQG